MLVLTRTITSSYSTRLKTIWSFDRFLAMVKHGSITWVSPMLYQGTTDFSQNKESTNATSRSRLNEQFLDMHQRKGLIGARTRTRSPSSEMPAFREDPPNSKLPCCEATLDMVWRLFRIIEELSFEFNGAISASEVSLVVNEPQWGPDDGTGRPFIAFVSSHTMSLVICGRQDTVSFFLVSNVKKLNEYHPLVKLRARTEGDDIVWIDKHGSVIAEPRKLCKAIFDTFLLFSWAC